MGVNIFKIDNSYAKVVWTGLDPNESTRANPLSLLDGSFAIHTPNYQFDERYKNRKFTRYDGKIHLFKKEIGLLPLGLTVEAINTLKMNGFNVNYSNDIFDSFNNKDYDESSIDKFIEKFSSNVFSPYYYQINALKLSIKKKRILFESPTGSGKSLLIYLIVRYLMWLNRNNNNKILIIVPSIMLVGQIFRDFKKDYKWSNLDEYVGLYNSELPIEYLNESLNKKILISTYHSVNNLINDDDEFIKKYGAVILDEAHKAKKDGKTLVKILNSCINAEYRIGMTGTIPKDKLFEKTLEASFGKKKVLVETDKLQEMGILSQCKVVKVEIPYTLESIKFMKTRKIKYEDEVKLVRLNESKHYAIGKLIDSGKITTKQNTLILCNEVKNGEIDDIANYLRENYPQFKIKIIHGKVKNKNDILESISEEEGIMVLSTYGSFSTGISIKRLHNAILASSLRSFETIIQAMGRILRTHDTKDLAVMYDCVDNIQVKMRSGNLWTGHVYDQWLDREKYYKEKKFPIETFTLDKEFDILNIIDELSKPE